MGRREVLLRAAWGASKGVFCIISVQEGNYSRKFRSTTWGGESERGGHALPPHPIPPLPAWINTHHMAHTRQTRSPTPPHATPYQAQTLTSLPPFLNDPFPLPSPLALPRFLSLSPLVVLPLSSLPRPCFALLSPSWSCNAPLPYLALTSLQVLFSPRSPPLAFFPFLPWPLVLTSSAPPLPIPPRGPIHLPLPFLPLSTPCPASHSPCPCHASSLACAVRWVKGLGHVFSSFFLHKRSEA